MAFTSFRTYVSGEIITAAILNVDHRDNGRYWHGDDGTAQVNSGWEVIGTAAYLRTAGITTTQRDALTGSAGMVVYNSSKGMHEGYGTAWREAVEVFGTSAQGDIVIRTGTGWDRIAIGGNEQYLKSDGTTGTWATVPGPSYVLSWMNSSQVIHTAPNQQYVAPNTDSGFSITPADREIIMPAAGTIGTAYVRVQTYSMDGTMAIQIYKNGGQALNISCGTVGTFSATGTATFVPGDKLTFAFLSAGLTGTSLVNTISLRVT